MTNFSSLVETDYLYATSLVSGLVSSGLMGGCMP